MRLMPRKSGINWSSAKEICWPVFTEADSSSLFQQAARRLQDHRNGQSTSMPCLIVKAELVDSESTVGGCGPALTRAVTLPADAMRDQQSIEGCAGEEKKGPGKGQGQGP